MSGLNVFGRLSPRMGARQAAEVVRAVQKPTHMLWRSFTGRYTTATLAGDHTTHLQFEVETEFTMLAISVPNLHTAGVGPVKVAVAVSDRMGSASSSDWATPSTGVWVSAAKSDGGSTLAPRVGSEIPSENIFYAPIRSIPREDGGVRPVVMVRIQHVSGSVITIPNVALSGWTTTGLLGRAIRHGTQAVLGVDAPASFTTTAVSGVNNCLPIVGYATPTPGVQQIWVGDSNIQGYGPVSGPNLSPFWLRSQFKQSSPQRPIECINAGIHANVPATYLARLKNLLTFVSPSIVNYLIYSINDAGAGGMSDAQYANAERYFLEALGLARSGGFFLRPITGFPCDPAFRNTGAGDSRRRALNAAAVAMSSPYKLPAFDAAAIVSGAENGDGQTLIKAGYSTDGVHFGVVAQDAMSDELIL